MSFARICSRFLLCAVLALALTACSAEEQTPSRQRQDSVGTTIPPKVETYGASQQGVVGEAAEVGDWTVLVKEVEFKNGDGAKKGDDEGYPKDGGKASERVKIEVDLSHDASEPLRVRREDWTLDDGVGGQFMPIESPGDPEKSGERVIQPGDTEDVTLTFMAERNGAYMLRFEPMDGGPGILQIAVP